ncbi:hypothetical protein ILYODFUR_021976, partial [Ilyodon furcidens]
CLYITAFETSKHIEPGRQQQPNWRVQRRGNINQELKYSRHIMSCMKTRCATVMLSSNQFLGLLLSITTACRQPMKILHCRRDDAGKRVKLLESVIVLLEGDFPIKHPLLFTLLTNDCSARHSSCHIAKFAQQ